MRVMDEMISPDAEVVVARFGAVDGFRFECWGEKFGRRLPGTVYVADLMQLCSELSHSALEPMLGTYPIDAMRRRHGPNCESGRHVGAADDCTKEYACSVVSTRLPAGA